MTRLISSVCSPQHIHSLCARPSSSIIFRRRMNYLLLSPWRDRFERLLACTENSLVLCAPFIARRPCEMIVDELSRRNLQQTVDLRIVTDLSRENMLQGVTDV